MRLESERHVRGLHPRAAVDRRPPTGVRPALGHPGGDRVGSEEGAVLVEQLQRRNAARAGDVPGAGIDGLDLAARIAESSPATRCLILTSHARPGYLKRALAQGVLGFLPKTTSADQLARAVRAVAAGRRVIDPELAAETIASGDSPLTPREADVLEFAADGAAIEQIARRAHLAEGTVRNYLSSAQAKLQAANRHEAVAIARRQGWI